MTDKELAIYLAKRSIVDSVWRSANEKVPVER